MSKVEFSDDQIKRLDEIQEAAMQFLKVLGESEDIPGDVEAIWDVVYAGEAALMDCLQRRVRIPTRVTLKDGTTFIVDYDDEITYDTDYVEEREHL